MKVVHLVGLGALWAMLALVTDGDTTVLLQMVLEALLTLKESAAVLAVGPGFEGTETEFPAPSAALGALVQTPGRVANVAGVAVVGPVDET